MHCQSRRLQGQHPASALAVPPGDPHARVGDADREAVVDLLGDAAAAGYLRPDELDERLAAVWSATTIAELSASESDLPHDLRRARARREAAARSRAAARAGLVPHLASYVGVMVLLLTIWLAIGLNGGSWYPWPVWPALGWGIGAAAHIRAAAAPSGAP